MTKKKEIYITLQQYADSKGITLQTVYNWIKEGILKTKTILGKQVVLKE